MLRIRKYEIILTVVWLIAVNLHRLFDASGIRADIYLLHNYGVDALRAISLIELDSECFRHEINGRLVSNILYEIGLHLSRLIPAFILAFRFNHIFFFTVFAYLILDFGAYLLFFGQGTNIYVIIITTIFLIIYQWKKQRKIYT